MLLPFRFHLAATATHSYPISPALSRPQAKALHRESYQLGPLHESTLAYEWGKTEDKYSLTKLYHLKPGELTKVPGTLGAGLPCYYLPTPFHGGNAHEDKMFLAAEECLLRCTQKAQSKLLCGMPRAPAHSPFFID